MKRLKLSDEKVAVSTATSKSSKENDYRDALMFALRALEAGTKAMKMPSTVYPATFGAAYGLQREAMLEIKKVLYK